ncbi:hypothetical protein [Bacillus sp. UNC69MF]|uniref:hypothetical protein n=1 Tax=Bacillus sp. UNC69MF TaxID=1449047 RepID=UPI000517CDB0|nr:hypothetical protein [Bacillus sp. UNC69MF]
MNLVSEKLLNILEDEIKKFNKELNKDVKLVDFEHLEADLKSINDEIDKEKVFFSEELSLIDVGMKCIGTLIFWIGEHDHFIAGNWTKEEYERINQTFQGLLTQLTNGLIGISKLIERGLDYQARVLFRNLAEMSWLTLVLIYDEEWLRMYIQDDKYEKYFRPYKIRNKLNEIENATELPQSIKDELNKNRKQIYKFYSEILHNTYPYPILGAMVKRINGEENLALSLFGKITRYSSRTIHEVNTCIYLFILMFYRALGTLHKLKVEGENDEYFASKSIILMNTFIKGYQSSLSKSEKAD